MTLIKSTYNEQYGTWEPSKPERVGQYAFVPLNADWVADRIRGEVVQDVVHVVRPDSSAPNNALSCR